MLLFLKTFQIFSVLYESFTLYKNVEYFNSCTLSLSLVLLCSVTLKKLAALRMKGVCGWSFTGTGRI